MEGFADREMRTSAPSPTGSLIQWGIAAICVAFFWTFVSVASQVWPATFPVPIRGSGLTYYNTSFAVFSPAADRALLLVCSMAVLMVLELRVRHLGLSWRALLTLPTLLLAALAVFPALLLLLIGAAGTILSIVYLVLDSSDLLGVPPGSVLASTLTAVSASTAAVFFLSAVRWMLNPIDGAPPLSGWTWSPSVLALKVLNGLYTLLPVLLLLLFICWPLVLVLAAYRSDLEESISKVSQRFAPPEDAGVEWLAPERFSPLLVMASLAGALFVGLYPYLPGINPSSMLVGADVRLSYYALAQRMVSQGPLAVIGFRLQADRTGFLLLQYALARLTGSVDLAVKIIPALLSVLFAATTYLFVRSGSRDGLLAGTASLFAAFSFQVVTAISGGLDANWLAASESLLFLSLLLVGLNRSDKRYVILSIVTSVLALFTHPWTWLVTMGVVAAYGLLTWARALVTRDRQSLRFELASVGSVVLVNLVIDWTKNVLGGPSGVQDVYSSSVSSLSLANLPHTLSTLQSTVTVYLGGALDNPILVALAIMGLLGMSDLLNRMNRLLLSWVAVASVGILLAPYSGEFFQARIVALVPFQVLAAIGFLPGLRYFTRLMNYQGHENQGLIKAFVIVSYVSVFGAMIGYTLLNVGFLWTG